MKKKYLFILPTFLVSACTLTTLFDTTPQGDYILKTICRQTVFGHVEECMEEAIKKCPNYILIKGIRGRGPTYYSEVLTLCPKTYLNNAVISDEEVKKLYEDYKGTFHGEKEVKAKHILVDSEAKAKEVIAQLNNGKQFDNLAKKYSKGPTDLGYFIKEMMVPEFADAAFSMKKGQFSKTPVKTQFGYHIILVEDIREAKPEDFEKIEPQLRAMLAKKAMRDIFKDL